MQVAISGREWTFDPDRSDGGVLVDRVNNDMPEYRTGKSYSFELVFFENTQDGSAQEPSTGGTLGGSSGFTLGGSNGATLGSPSDPAGHVDRYEEVREYSRWAGRYAMNEAIDGTPRYSEHTPSSASVDSIVVKLSPSDQVERTDGLWVILDDVKDQTRFIRDTARIQIRFTVLARADQYDTRTDVQNALGSDLA